MNPEGFQEEAGKAALRGDSPRVEGEGDGDVLSASTLEEKGNGDAGAALAEDTQPSEPGDGFDDSPASRREFQKPPAQTLSARPEDIDTRTLDAGFHPDRPPETWEPAYAEQMLTRYRKTWLVAWEIYESADNHRQGVGRVVRAYKHKWPEFLEDLKRHRANERAGVGYAEDLKANGPEATDVERIKEYKAPVWCNGCKAVAELSIGAIFRDPTDGSERCDTCEKCHLKLKKRNERLGTEEWAVTQKAKRDGKSEEEAAAIGLAARQVLEEKEIADDADREERNRIALEAHKAERKAQLDKIKADKLLAEAEEAAVKETFRQRQRELERQGGKMGGGYVPPEIEPEDYEGE